MPQSNQINSQSNSVYEIVNCGANLFIAFAATVDGSNNPVWAVGTCNDRMGNNFVEALSINCVTGVLKVGGVQVTIP